MNPSLRKYFSKIGRKGGKAKGPLKQKAARRAAQSRWRREHPVPKPPPEK